MRPDVIRTLQDQNQHEARSHQDITRSYQDKARPSQDIAGSI